MLLIDLFREGFPPKSTFSVDDIPDLSGKVIIVTGANTGVGKETAKALLNHNAKVYIAARSQEKTEKAIQDLKNETGKEAIFLKLDLASLNAIKAAAEEFLSKETELHVLFNNAGVMVPPIDDLTADGYDLQFGTNTLGHFYFTKLLLPALLKGAKSSPDGTARVVNTSSSASLFASKINFDTLKDSPARRKSGPNRLYMQSKLGNAIFAKELARRYGDQGIVSTGLNPGNLSSDLQRHLGRIETKLVGLLLHPTPMGALTQLWAGTTQEGATLNGKYLIPWARIGTGNPVIQDEKVGADLWKWFEDQVANI
ncbi:hypothetical protein EST38_g1427 [Candolleomyces aberdarensis]|uniref:NAD(P)-binding protein n=1 Tax=Candolleomyces aberdarensis TaxID=2316362 RepID=A0A4Q2DVV9_9AGAR|nr:hypothetical protein EST38_g1427 [Candolleomyces aberdarensis]